MNLRRVIAAVAGAALALAAAVGPGRAETHELRISRGYGIHFLPLYVMEEQRLIEQEAAAAGLGDIKVDWRIVDGGNVINDAMLAGALDIAGIGVPGFLTLWAKAKGNPRLEIVGLGGVGAGSTYLNTRNPAIKTIRDFTDKDKIALPGIKTSFNAFILEMAAAKEFGDAAYARLDPLTVGMPYPEATAALISGKTEITAHLASPPFSYVELDHPGIHRVFSSVDIIGPHTVIMAYTTRRFRDENPKLAAAFIAALRRATDFAMQHKREAARIYLKSVKVKTSEEDLMRILSDPDTRFSVTPQGTMKFAAFMNRVGVMRTKPENWQELFVRELHELPGS